ncbi:hypothetical protein ACFQJ5_15160 [Halomicroarcula sp. GCM10025324]|uniref:hypothetical protein n=1 Tax=Haloarcula TaxID=2237 RepID=UPI0023E770AE|nr:hypothetical protein [Halomicroarcula sp. ZS-22-S1]
MVLAIGHFALGATLTTVLVVLLGSRVPFPRTVVLLGGGFALLPDLQQIDPLAGPTLAAFHNSAVADLFWFHRTLDVLDPGDSALVAGALVAVFVLVTAVSELWDYHLPATVTDVGDGIQGTDD